MVYNLSLGNETGMLTLVQTANSELMMGWLGVLFLIGLAFILFTSFIAKSGDVGKSVVATSFIIFVLALSLRAMDLIPNLAIFITLIASAIAIAWTWNK